jgi:hypothetical protein
MVRTCNGLELRDPGMFTDTEDLVEDPNFFPSASSRDELTPRYKRDQVAPVLTLLLQRELEAGALNACRVHGTTPPPGLGLPLGDDLGNELGPGPLEDALCRESNAWYLCPEVHKAIDGVRFIADHTRREEDSTKVWTRHNLQVLEGKWFAGEGRLEVCSDGFGSIVPVDIYAGGARRYSRNNPASSDALRRSKTNRRETVGDRVHRSQTPYCQFALNDT